MFGQFMKAQGTVIPTMFVGLGGIGSRMVDRIGGRAARLPNWEQQLRGLTTFVCVDTNILDLNSLKNVPDGSRIHIGAVDKRKIVENYQASNNRQALQWIDRNYQPREGVKPGAGQIRVESRLGYHYASPGTRRKFDELIRYTLDPNNNWRQNNPRYYYVYLYCSLAGGTGSGSFLPVAYLIHDLLTQQGWQPRIIGNLVLSTLLKRKVAPDLHPNIHANTYAALKELEHLSKLNYQAVKLERPQGDPFVFWNNENSQEIPHVRHAPFFHSFVFDRPGETDIVDVEDTLADASFLQVFTPVIDSLAGEYDNYEQHLQDLTHFPGDNKSIGRGYTKNFGAFGTAVLSLPAADLLEYSALRFAAEALRRQITFGASASSDADNRDRKLEQHRVNYDDPAFRNLDEGARFARINEAFVLSVQSMADMDKQAGQKGGYWFRLVEETDQGELQAVEDGKEIRTASLIEKVTKYLDDTREPVIKRVSIKNRAFVFTREGVNQYAELLTKFKEDIRNSEVEINLGKERLKVSARDGDPISTLDNPRPTPMQERYLIIQLLSRFNSKLIPEAKAEVEKTRTRTLANPGVQERLEKEIPASLNEAAQTRGRFGLGWDEEGFTAVRNGAQTEFQDVGRSQVRYFDAQLRLEQYLAFVEYLTQRARQYATVATRINDVVRELEAEAESLRSGVAQSEPRLALSVEVFETLDKPRRRMWPQVYDDLFIREGRDLSTFDRQTLSTVIAKQLEPVKDPQTGRFIPKSEFGLIADLKRVTVELGRERLRKTIYGDQEHTGLTLESALRMEARIVLPQRPGRPLTDEELLDYAAEKFRAVHLMGSLVARTKTEEMRSLDDGVKLARKRHFLMQRGSASPEFYNRFRMALQKPGWDLSEAEIDNPHIAVLHDSELPIPLYYFEAVTSEVEAAYEKVMSNERRAFNLHIDFNWEHSLPDLNPRKAEIGVTWSLETLLDGLLTKVMTNTGTEWVWIRSSGQSERLGSNLSAALYTVVDLHNDDVLGDRLKKGIAETKGLLGTDEMRVRAELFSSWVGRVLEDVQSRTRAHQSTPDDELDKPILRALDALVRRRLGKAEAAEAASAGVVAGAPASQAPMGF